METWPFLAVLASALLHASWNALARSAPEPGEAMVAGVILSGGLGVGGLFVTGLPDTRALPWLVGGVIVNVIGIRLAMAAYRRASYGLAYPVMRAGIPLLMLPIGFLLLGEWPGFRGAAGVLFVATALIMLAIAARKAGGAELAGFGYALLAALAGAGYVSADAGGVRVSGNVFAYAFMVSVLNAAAIAALTAVEGRNVRGILQVNARRGGMISVISAASFLLYIAALAVTPVALAAALRETSVLFAVAIAHFALRETIGRWHLAAAALAMMGVVGIRLA